MSRISERKREKGNGVQNGRLESIAEGEGRERGGRSRAHLARNSREFIGRERAVGPTSRAPTRSV